MMSDLSKRMTEYAWISYEKYMELNQGKDCDFNSFAVGYFLGAVAASGNRKDITHDKT
jgi:hypothetical protein